MAKCRADEDDGKETNELRERNHGNAWNHWEIGLSPIKRIDLQEDREILNAQFWECTSAAHALQKFKLWLTFVFSSHLAANKVLKCHEMCQTLSPWSISKNLLLNCRLHSVLEHVKHCSPDIPTWAPEKPGKDCLSLHLDFLLASQSWICFTNVILATWRLQTGKNDTHKSGNRKFCMLSGMWVSSFALKLIILMLASFQVTLFSTPFVDLPIAFPDFGLYKNC